MTFGVMYRVVRPSLAPRDAPATGLIVSDSFTMLRRPFMDCMPHVLNAWYLETGEVVAGIAVGGAAFGRCDGKRYADIASWVSRQSFSFEWTLCISMGNDVYRVPAQVSLRREHIGWVSADKTSNLFSVDMLPERAQK